MLRWNFHWVARNLCANLSIFTFQNLLTMSQFKLDYSNFPSSKAICYARGNYPGDQPWKKRGLLFNSVLDLFSLSICGEQLANTRVLQIDVKYFLLDNFCLRFAEFRLPWTNCNQFNCAPRTCQTRCSLAALAQTTHHCLRSLRGEHLPGKTLETISTPQSPRVSTPPQSTMSWRMELWYVKRLSSAPSFPAPRSATVRGRCWFSSSPQAHATQQTISHKDKWWMVNLLACHLQVSNQALADVSPCRSFGPRHLRWAEVQIASMLLHKLWEGSIIVLGSICLGPKSSKLEKGRGSMQKTHGTVQIDMWDKIKLKCSKRFREPCRPRVPSHQISNCTWSLWNWHHVWLRFWIFRPSNYSKFACKALASLQRFGKLWEAHVSATSTETQGSCTISKHHPSSQTHQSPRPDRLHGYVRLSTFRCGLKPISVWGATNTSTLELGVALGSLISGVTGSSFISLGSLPASHLHLDEAYLQNCGLCCWQSHFLSQAAPFEVLWSCWTS